MMREKERQKEEKKFFAPSSTFSYFFLAREKAMLGISHSFVVVICHQAGRK